MTRTAGVCGITEKCRGTYHEDGGSTVLRNVGTHLTNQTQGDGLNKTAIFRTTSNVANFSHKHTRRAQIVKRTAKSYVSKLNILKPTGYVKHQKVYHSTILQPAHTVFLHPLSHNKQRLFRYAALTGRLLQQR